MASIPSSNVSSTVFDLEQFRFPEPPRRIFDLEKDLCSTTVSTLYSLPSQEKPQSQPQPQQQNHHLQQSPPYHHLRQPPQHHKLPPDHRSHLIHYIRYTLFAVYQRLFTLILLLNVAAVLILLHHYSWRATEALNLNNLATLTSSNFLLAILSRQDYLLNLLFRTAWLVPWSLPLRVRKAASRVYCYGGIHSGAALAGTAWWLLFTGVMSWEGVARGRYTPVLLVVTLVIASLLGAVVVLSLPRLRVRYHDAWEMVHRGMGWSAVALFWAQVVLLAQYESATSPTSNQGLTKELIATPTFWNLVVMTLLLIYPWLRLRRWTFTATPLSSHALQLSFPNPVHKYSCLALSSSPLMEWHPFATFPQIDPLGQRTGSSIVVSAAGDWTRHLITTVQSQQARQLTTHPDVKPSPVKLTFYIKSHPRAGVLSLSCLYKRVLIVTTGSGIGPCLSSLLDRPAGQTARLVWATRSPLRTYGSDILRLVQRADPEAIVLDTDQQGRPDLLGIAWSVYKAMAAEAVFVLSNEAVTRVVVGGLERRGVPAFGPIWDS